MLQVILSDVSLPVPDFLSFLCMLSHHDSFLFGGPQAQGYSWNDAYGKFLGTNMVCSFATTLISFLPPRVLRKLFPTWIAGLTVFLVGVTLIGVAGISVSHLYPCMHSAVFSRSFFCCQWLVKSLLALALQCVLQQ